MSIGLLILRVVVGALFIGHGTQKLFGWFGGRGLRATGDSFDGMGFRPGTLMAVVAGIAEAGGGALLALGLLTPLAAAAIVGVMLNAILAVHAKNGVWNTKGGIEFPLTNASAATALAFTGPGRYSLDRAVGFTPGHVASGMFGLALGTTVALLVFAMRRPAAPASPDRVPARRDAA
jgi:putative oxidoreductase